MMYYALTGRGPFSGENSFAIMMAHARDPVVPPSELSPRVPADLEQIVLRCLEKKRVDRFQTVNILGAALAACASAGDWGPSRADAWWASLGLVAQTGPQPEISDTGLQATSVADDQDQQPR